MPTPVLEAVFLPERLLDEVAEQAVDQGAIGVQIAHQAPHASLVGVLIDRFDESRAGLVKGAVRRLQELEGGTFNVGVAALARGVVPLSEVAAPGVVGTRSLIFVSR